MRVTYSRAEEILADRVRTKLKSVLEKTTVIQFLKDSGLDDFSQKQINSFVDGRPISRPYLDKLIKVFNEQQRPLQAFEQKQLEKARQLSESEKFEQEGVSLVSQSAASWKEQVQELAKQLEEKNQMIAKLAPLAAAYLDDMKRYVSTAGGLTT